MYIEFFYFLFSHQYSFSLIWQCHSDVCNMYYYPTLLIFDNWHLFSWHSLQSSHKCSSITYIYFGLIHHRLHCKYGLEMTLKKSMFIFSDTQNGQPEEPLNQNRDYWYVHFPRNYWSSCRVLRVILKEESVPVGFISPIWDGTVLIMNTSEYVVGVG